MRLFRGTIAQARLTGALLCIAGILLLTAPSLIAAALGLELIAAAFWWWARAAGNPEREVGRWAWLRRPAMALWLAVAIHAALPALASPAFDDRPAFELWRRIDAIAVVWAGLELVAALPLARPFSDLPGPLLGVRTWLPVILPVAGFAVLARQSPVWTGIPEVRRAAGALLLLTAGIASVRAFGLRRWTTSLRWLAIADTALGGVLLASGAVSPLVAVLLWAGAFGGHAFLLAGELRGAAPRRGPWLSGLWRAATWNAVTALAWPALIGVGFDREGHVHALRFAAIGIPVLLMAWITVGRMVEAPERRTVVRAGPPFTLGHVYAALTLVLGPAALWIATWSGYRVPWSWALAGFVPPLLGGILSLANTWRAGREARRGAMAAPAPGAARASVAGRVASFARQSARVAFRAWVALELFVVRTLGGLARGLVAPLRDLNSGDPQEYLLFLVGVSVLAVLLPLLR